MIKIKVCIPSHSEKYIEELFKQLNKVSGCEFKVVVASGSVLFQLRNTLISQNGELEYDYYLFVDDDTAFSADHVVRLISIKKDIVGSACARKGKFTYCAGSFKEVDGVKVEGVTEDSPLGTRGVNKVDWMGMAFTKISKQALEKMGDGLWFRHEFFENEGKKDQTGEDVGFCMNAKEAGIDIYCDFDFPVVHLYRD